MNKGLFAGLALVASCVLSLGCAEPINIDSSQLGLPTPPIVVPTPGDPPDQLPSDAMMGMAFGPVAVNLEKWGPDPSEPFSWPGRVVQVDQTHPSQPQDQLVYEIRLSDGDALHKVHVWVEPSKGHTSVPYSRAQVMVWSYNGGFKEYTLLANPVTTLGDSVVNYEQRYLLTTDLDEPFIANPDTRIFVYVFGEYGEGSVMGMAVDTPEIVYETS